MMTIFKIGKKFSTYSELEEAIKLYEKQTLSKFWKRDARLIGSSRMKRTINEKLKYIEIKYCCIYGGQKFRPSTSGQRETKTFKNEEPCLAHIALQVSTDGRALVVRSISEIHNHEKLQFLTHARKSVEEIAAAHKKSIKDNNEQELEKNLTLQDLFNMKNRSGEKSKNLEECANILRNKYNADINIMKDDKENFKAIFIQTPGMKRILKTYPEFLSIDVIYKLRVIGIPVFLLTIQDGNCQLEIVAFCLFATEDEENFIWFLQTFKTNNWQLIQSIKCVAINKDLIQKSIIEMMFPEVHLIICRIFHPMQIFHREITCEKLRISQLCRAIALQNIEKMVYAKTEDEFECLYEILKKTTSQTFIEYFDQNWYVVKDEWSMYKNSITKSITDNYIESLNAKLRMIITKNSTLEKFVYSFFNILQSLEMEREFKSAYQLQKRLGTWSYAVDSDEKFFFDHLTNESSKIVIKEIEYSTKIKILHDSPFIIDGKEGKFQSTLNNCECTLNAAMLLPCRHIFAVRKHLNLPLFSEELINERWTIDFYKKNQKNLTNLYNNVFDINAVFEPLAAAEIKKKPTQRNKPPENVIQITASSYGQTMALLITNSLAHLAAKSRYDSFDQRIENLKTLELYWKQNMRTKIIMVNEEDGETEELTSESSGPCLDSHSDTENATILKNGNDDGSEENKQSAVEWKSNTINENGSDQEELNEFTIKQEAFEEEHHELANSDTNTNSNITGGDTPNLPQTELVPDDNLSRKRNMSDEIILDSIKKPCLECTDKTLDLEERRLTLEERKVELENKRFELEKEERMKRFQLEMKEREANIRIIEQQQQDITLFFKEFLKN